MINLTKVVLMAVALLLSTIQFSQAGEQEKLTPVGDVFMPAGAPPEVQDWQAYDIPKNAVFFWDYAEAWLKQTGNTENNVLDVFRWTLDLPENSKVAWKGSLLSDGKTMVPAFQAEERIVLPYIPTGNSAAATASIAEPTAEEQAAFNEFMSRFEKLESTVAGHSDDIAGLTSDVSAMQRTIADQKRQIEGLVSKIDGATIGVQQRSVEEIQQIVEDMIAAGATSSAVMAVEAEVTEALGLNDPAIVAWQSSMETQYAALAERVTEVEKGLRETTVVANDAMSVAGDAEATANDASSTALAAQATASEATTTANNATAVAGEAKAESAAAKSTADGVVADVAVLSGELDTTNATVAAQANRLDETANLAAEANGAVESLTNMQIDLETRFGEQNGQIASNTKATEDLAEKLDETAKQAAEAKGAVEGLTDMQNGLETRFDEQAGQIAGNKAAIEANKTATEGLASKDGQESNTAAISKLNGAVAALICVVAILLILVLGLILGMRLLRKRQNKVEERQAEVETELRVVAEEVATKKKVDFQFDDILKRLIAGEDIGRQEEDVWMSGDGQRADLRIRLEEPGMVRILSGIRGQTQLIKTGSNLKVVLMRAWNDERVEVTPMAIAAE